ncbi:hypothetical protein Tco_0642323 [Tanacetum coccineum]
MVGSLMGVVDDRWMVLQLSSEPWAALVRGGSISKGKKGWWWWEVRTTSVMYVSIGTNTLENVCMSSSRLSGPPPACKDPPMGILPYRQRPVRVIMKYMRTAVQY